MRWKGYSAWFGLFGYLGLFGLIILACFPNKRKRALANDERGHSAQADGIAQAHERPGYLFLLGLVPLLEEYLAQGYVAGFAEPIRSYLQWLESLCASRARQSGNTDS